MKITKFFKNCPSCNKTLYYADKYKLKRSLLQDTLCQSCFSKKRSCNKDYLKKLSKSIKLSWTKERKIKQSIFFKNFWKNLSIYNKKAICQKMSNSYLLNNRINQSKTNLIKAKNNPLFLTNFYKSIQNQNLVLKRKQNMLKQHLDLNSKLNSKEVKQKRIESFKKNWKNKSIEDKNKILNNLLKTTHSFHSKFRATSKLEIEVFKEIEHLGFEHKGVISGFCIDIKHKTLPIIIEVNGDFWHANPSIYDRNWFNKVNKKFAYQIWEKDFLRVEKLKSIGFLVYVVWEKDIGNKKYINEITELVNKYEKKSTYISAI